MEHKYVRDRYLGFILWPTTDTIIHADIGRMSRNPISAGFVRFEEGKPTCFGLSLSLGIDSHPEDSGLLAEQLGLK